MSCYLKGRPYQFFTFNFSFFIYLALRALIIPITVALPKRT